MRRRAALLLLALSCSRPPEPAPEGATCGDPTRWTLVDRFCRDLGVTGLQLVDWDGHLANPAVPVTLMPPSDQAFPVHVALTTDSPRLYFDLGGRLERIHGVPFGPPSASVDIADAGALSFRIAIWPDRDGFDEVHALHFTLGDATLDVPVSVRDEDLGTDAGWPVTLSFAHDQTPFFIDPLKRAIAAQAVSDWSYFFDGAGLDPVAAGTEETFVDGPMGWQGARPLVANDAAYTGTLVYGVGIHTTEVRSTGYPTKGPFFESSDGGALPGRLCRSGSLEVETTGDYGSPGWSLSLSDDDWYALDNRADVPTDLASIVHHELGHALFFDEQYARFVSPLTSDAIAAYASAPLAIDATQHFAGVLDPASGLGAFGNEYAETGTLPRRRWIITKLDLLAAQAVGYPLKTGLSPFVDVHFTGASLVTGAIGTPYAGQLVAAGGVPPYGFAVPNGALPPGLGLDALTGAVRGTPTSAGSYTFDVVVTDQLGVTATASGVTLTVE